MQNPASGGEQLEQVGHLVEVLDAQQAVRLDQRLPGRVAAGEGTRVRADQRRARRGATDSEEHDRYVARSGAVQCRAQPLRFAHGLEQQRDDAGLVEVEGVVEIVGGRRDQLLPGRDGQREADAAGGCAATPRTPSPSAR